MNASDDAAIQQRALARAVDASVLGAALAALVDWLLSASRGVPVVGGLIFLLCAAVMASLGAAVALWLLSSCALALDEKLPRWRGTANTLASLVLVSPVVYACCRQLLEPGKMTAAALAAALLLWAVAATIIRRHASPGAWLVSAMGCATVFFVVADSLWLFDRISPSRPSVHLALVIGGVAGGIVLAFGAGHLIAWCRGTPVPLFLRLGSAALGIGGVAATRLVSIEYPTARRGMLLASLLLLALSCTRCLRRRTRVILVAGAAAGTLYFVFLASPFSAFRAAIIERTVLGRELVQATGVFRPAFSRLRVLLLRRPETRNGASLSAAATAWNRQTSPLSDQFRGASVVLITVDALRYDRTGYSGHAPPGLTPSIARLASRSLRFSRCYVQGGWTSLSIPSMMWSRHPKSIAFVPIYETNDFRLFRAGEIPRGARVERAFQAPLAERNKSLARVMAEAGFHTVAVPHDGYTHYFDPHLGFVNGFARVIYPRTEARRRRRIAPTDDGFAADLAVEALRAHDWRKRLFMWVHFYQPHEPYGSAPQENRFAGYERDVHYADRQVGRLFDALAGLGRSRDTIVIVAGDHGEEQGERGDNSHGLWLFDESVRVPLLIKIPRREGRDVRDEVGLIDIAPTVLDLVGVRIPASMQGFKLTPLLGGKAPGCRPPVFMETWRNEIGSSRKSLHLVGAVAGGEKIVVDWTSPVFSYYRVADGEKADLLGLGEDAVNERFMRLGALLLGWYCAGSARAAHCAR